MEMMGRTRISLEHGRRATSRAGVTLLEVLVACGILVIGLASIASILPAAGVRLGQANLEDRAGTAAANAYADIVSRGLLSADIFGTGTNQSAAFGQWPTNFVASATLGPVRFLTAAAVGARFDPDRGPVLEDDLVFNSGGLADTPTNAFFRGPLNTITGPREYRPSVCWAALLTPDVFPATAGGVATLSVAVFRKPPADVKRLQLTGQRNSFQFLFTGSAPGEAEVIRKQCLQGCSYVLALPRVQTLAPRWIKIQSSWTKDSENGFVILDMAPLGVAATEFMTPSGMTQLINVLAVENLLRVDQYPVSLE